MSLKHENGGRHSVDSWPEYFGKTFDLAAQQQMTSSWKHGFHAYNMADVGENKL